MKLLITRHSLVIQEIEVHSTGDLAISLRSLIPVETRRDENGITHISVGGQPCPVAYTNEWTEDEALADAFKYNYLNITLHQSGYKIYQLK